MTFWGLGSISLNIEILPFRRNWVVPKLASIAKLSGNVNMWVGVARMLYNNDVTIVTSTMTSIVTSQQ